MAPLTASVASEDKGRTARLFLPLFPSHLFVFLPLLLKRFLFFFSVFVVVELSSMAEMFSGNTPRSRLDRSGLHTSNSGAAAAGETGLVMPLEEVSPALLASAGRNLPTSSGANEAERTSFLLQQASGLTPARATSVGATATPTTMSMMIGGSAGGGGGGGLTSATVDFQRSLVQQQLQQAQREIRKLKEELQDTSGKLGQVTTKLNEQKVEFSSLTHRYSTVVEKLTGAEGDAKKLEDQLVQERNRLHQLRETKEQLTLQLRDANWDRERLQRTIDELESNRGLDQREVQRLLEDRAQYMPTVEVRRMQSELRDAQQSLVDRLTAALDGLLVSDEESETALFVARSAVLSAATDLEARVVRAEAALDAAYDHLCQHKEGLERETNDFVLALMTENKELWQLLTKLQSEHDLTLAELQLKDRRGESVPLDQHQYVQRQLENMTDRLGKAQKLVEAQTALAREHEAEMQDLLNENDELREQVASLSAQLAECQEASRGKSTALQEADEALQGATKQIEELQDAIVRERDKADHTLQQLNSTNDAIQHEYEQRIRQLQSERDTAEEAASNTQRELEETVAKLSDTASELTRRTELFEEFKQRAEESHARDQQAQLDEMTHVRDVLEQEMEQLRRELEQANEAARAAERAKEEGLSHCQAAELARKAVENELAAQRRENEQQQHAVADAVERARAAAAELELVRSRAGEESTSVKELQLQLQRLGREKADQAAHLQEELDRSRARCEQLQKDWHNSEKARTSLQDELKALRTRCAEMEAAQNAQERYAQDRVQLMKENLRLHEQYQAVQEENRELAEHVKAQREKEQAVDALMQQLDELQQRLRELPQLRQAADDARRESLKAREETEVLRRERDEMAAKLDYFLEESKAAAQMDSEFDRAVRDASEAVKRLGGQVTAAKGRGASAGGGGHSGGTPYHVFANTRPTGRLSSPMKMTMAGGRTGQQQQQQRSPRQGSGLGAIPNAAATTPTRRGGAHTAAEGAAGASGGGGGSPSALPTTTGPPRSSPRRQRVDAATLASDSPEVNSNPQRPWKS